ncbi:hypothetical protein [Candidatus Aalborgicola defluviihabitans]|jgi:hypothetical protein|uniref:hypothetical protein n=1 Tax=Candidatus Aalborgicola defluviihabitans TaxID=3386187 RepID=UPI001D673E1A|nr:hypothetical protein [Burkholderiales bacterium]MBK6568818.1 hypothetical protein [Burkholderiales bacterium]MBK7281110.1 hypothetical protein [Burkholderiales bacterium]MBK7313795.1 hypothetical protein [Burkholderiales bacterium]MBL0245465.1 hypothetical protein [Rhodoferax sp.]
MSKLLDYLNLLDSDATAREAHQQDPQASMTQFGLNAEEQQTLMSGDIAAIAALAGVDASDLPKVNVTNTDLTY